MEGIVSLGGWKSLTSHRESPYRRIRKIAKGDY